MKKYIHPTPTFINLILVNGQMVKIRANTISNYYFPEDIVLKKPVVKIEKTTKNQKHMSIFNFKQ